MRVSAKTDYAVRAMVQLTAASAEAPTKAEHVAVRQRIPLRFLLNILAELRLARLVVSRRGTEGGYYLAHPAGEISIADVIRAVEGPLADVHGEPPEALEYREPTSALRDVWLATRAALRQVLENVTLDDVASNRLPDHVVAQLADPDTLRRR